MEYVAAGLLVLAIIFGPLILAVIALSATGKLREQLQALERRVSQLADGQAPAAPAVAQSAAPAPPAAPADAVLERAVVAPPVAVRPIAVAQGPVTPLPAPAAPTARGTDLERMIGGKWLNWIGIFALLLGSAFFLKFAFDNNWIGPIGRVTIGFLAGTALIVYSQWLHKKTYVYFSEGIAGLGAGVLFLSLYASWNYYHFITDIEAFIGMALVTAVLLGLALARDSQRIAVLALVGGFITPLLLNTGVDAELQLFGYLALLNAGLLWVAQIKNWRWLPAAFIFTLAYFWLWYSAHYDPSKLDVTLVFATVFYIEFAALPLLRALRTGSLYDEQAVLTLLNAAWYVVALNAMLSQHRWTLTLAIVFLAIAHLVVAQRAAPAKGTPLARVLYGGLALTLVTLAIPIRLQGAWITIGWAIEGAVLVWSGVNTNTRLLRAAGLIIFMLVVGRLIVSPLEGGPMFLNLRFETFAIVIACFGVAASAAAHKRDELAPGERVLFYIVQVGINVLALWALTLEVTNYTIPDQRQQLLVTLVWTVYAAVLLILGVRYRSKLLRWQGLVLLGIAIIKVFLFDLSQLSLGLRILSFMALGLVLLGISFLYQKRFAGDTTEDRT